MNPPLPVHAARETGTAAIVAEHLRTRGLDDARTAWAPLRLSPRGTGAAVRFLHVVDGRIHLAVGRLHTGSR